MITPEDHKILSADAAWHAAQAKILRAYFKIVTPTLTESGKAMQTDVEMHEATAAALNRVLESAVIK